MRVIVATNPTVIVMLIGLSIFFIGITVGFSVSFSKTNDNVAALRETVASLSPVVLNTQTGTCVFGFPNVPYGNPKPQSIYDFVDHVNITYSFSDILLSGIPAGVVTFGQTPRPIVFNAYNPPITQPNSNDLVVYMGLCTPPIQFINSKVGYTNLVSYSQAVADNIVMSPNCVGARNAAHCVQEQGYWSRSLNYVFYNNSFVVYSTGLNTDTVMSFIWGQWAYGSFGAQYNFSGTTIEITNPLVISIPN